MISVADLKQLIYRETGYKIQVQDNDPILAAFYVNLATLGEALKHAECIQESIKGVINSLPASADREMQRAGDAALRTLSSEVGRIAQRLAGDAAAAEKGKAIALAVKWTAAGVLACAVVFGGVGYGIRMLADEANLSIARHNLQVAKASSEADIAAAEKKASDEINAIQKNSGWIGTEEGRLAKKFFDIGAGSIAAKCDSPSWEIVDGKDGKFCVPKRRDLFGGDGNKYGWKIP